MQRQDLPGRNFKIGRVIIDHPFAKKNLELISFFFKSLVFFLLAL